MSKFDPSPLARPFTARSWRSAARPPADTIMLSIGDPDFDTPAHIRKALMAALDEGATHYANWGGDPELRSALAAAATRRAGRECSDAQVVLTHGGNAALAATILTVVGPGQRVVIPSPTYPLYATLVRAAGGEPVMVPHRSDYHLDLDAIATAAVGARLIVLCHPSNPTCAVYTRAELEAVATIAERNDLYVLSDEAYDHALCDGVPFTSTLAVASLAERLLYVQTFSKTYAMTGWRLGYVLAPVEVADAVMAVHRSFNGALNTAVQRAALAAITGPQDEPERMRREYQVRRELVSELLHGTPGVELGPAEATFYAYVRHSPDLESAWVQQRALERGVAVRTGSDFGPGGEGHLRIALVAPREVLGTAIGRLRAVLEEEPRGRSGADSRT
ncbi:MAG: pyridoxal phosphate-dependent aminotransferase [Candidatus Dormibacteraceae bacterium]